MLSEISFAKRCSLRRSWCCHCSFATARIFGCSDIPLGVSIGLFDVTANGSEEGQSGTTSTLPYQPWAEALVKQRLADERKDDPTTRCLPISPVRQWADFFPQKIIQTGDSVVILSEYMAQFRQIFLDGRYVYYFVTEFPGGWLDLFSERNPLANRLHRYFRATLPD